METKTCSSCLSQKPLTDYTQRKRECRECRNKKAKEFYIANREKCIIDSQLWKLNNEEKLCREVQCTNFKEHEKSVIKQPKSCLRSPKAKQGYIHDVEKCRRPLLCRERHRCSPGPVWWAGRPPLGEGGAAAGRRTGALAAEGLTSFSGQNRRTCRQPSPPFLANEFVITQKLSMEKGGRWWGMKRSTQGGACSAVEGGWCSGCLERDCHDETEQST